MPIRPLHRVEDAPDEGAGNLLVEQIAHRVDEHAARLPPAERLLESLGPEPQVEALLVGVGLHTPEPLCDPFRVAVVAARADLRAPRHGVPRRVSPFDRGCLSQDAGPPRRSGRHSRCFAIFSPYASPGEHGFWARSNGGLNGAPPACRALASGNQGSREGRVSP